MEEKIKNLKKDVPEVDVAGKVMGEISKKDIRMKHPLIFLAQNLGLQSVLVLVIVFGALVIDTGFYLIKKTGSFHFLGFGAPGLQIFLRSFPFDYLALLIVTLLVANYLLKKLDLSRGLFLFANAPIIFLFILVVLAGLFFGKMGANEIIKSRTACRLPWETAAYGEVMEVSKNEITIKAMDGHVEKIIFGKEVEFPYNSDYATGKFLRATGFQDKKDPAIFHANQIHCCDAE